MKRTLTAVLLTIAVALPALAQRGPNPADFTVTAAERKEAIEGSIARLKEGYVFPKVALEMEKAVLDRMKKGEYDAITSAHELAKKLTDDFRAVSNDKHLGVRHFPNGAPDFSAPLPPEHVKQEQEWMRKTNFGFEKVERLRGNIGYVDIRGFVAPADGGATASAAMSFIANTDALIVDLRKNGGGEPAMIALVTSYLFDEPTHLNDIWAREGEKTHQWWTSGYVPGLRFGATKPVYVLTSSRTFSGGEEFAYNLKNLKRATLIGETTGGGAHPVQPYRIAERFAIGVPNERAISPITKTNWEGTGVAPDIAMPADQAFDAAYDLAIRKLIETSTDGRWKGQLESLLAERTKE